MLEDHNGKPTTYRPGRARWFRPACVVVAAELVALIVVVVGPRVTSGAGAVPTAGATRAAHATGLRRSAATEGAQSAAPPVATTTVPVVTPTTQPPVPTTTVPPAPAPAPVSAPVPASTAATATAVAAPAPAASVSGHPILPPSNPAADIAPQPDFLAVCAAGGYDDSDGCVDAAVAAIDNARSSEGLPGMVLPSNWSALTPAEQLFVATDLERTVRGLPPLSAMASALDQTAAQAAAAGVDPSPPAGFPFTEWGGDWAGGVSNPLEALYFWMYDDGPGSSNVDCAPGNSSGCWGHRDKVLMAMACQPCVMGSGFSPQAGADGPSWAEVLVDTSGAPASDFTWQEEAAYLP